MTLASEPAAQSALIDTVAAGELGLASVLVAAAVRDASAPPRVDPSGGTGERENDDDDGDDDDASLCPLCAAPLAGGAGLGGCVACADGHALHASCAADWILGGGGCPTCRAPLFAGRVPASTARAASLAHETAAMLASAAPSAGDCVRLAVPSAPDNAAARDVLGEFVGWVGGGARARVHVARRDVATVTRPRRRAAGWRRRRGPGAGDKPPPPAEIARVVAPADDAAADNAWRAVDVDAAAVSRACSAEEWRRALDQVRNPLLSRAMASLIPK